MQTIALLSVFFALALAADDVIQLDLIQTSVHQDVFKAKQAKRLAKWGKAARSLPKYHQKLLESNFKNDYITTNIQFGSPAQNFTVMISSGATRAWVFDAEFAHKTSQQHGYSPTKSSTSVNTSTYFDEIDGSFFISGNWYTDAFQFGNTKIKSQGFGSIDQIYDYKDEQEQARFPVDGVFGISHLGPDAYRDNKEPISPIDNLLASLTKKVVTIFLEKQVPPSKGSSSGALTIGGFDNKNCDAKNTIASMPFGISTQTNQLIIGIHVFNYGNYELKRGNALIDSGSSTIQLPSEAFHNIYTTIKPDYDWNTGIYTTPCKLIPSVTFLQFKVGDNAYVKVYPDSYVVDLDLADGQCALALEAMSSVYLDYVLGTPFHREGCLFFDYHANQVTMFGRL